MAYQANVAAATPRPFNSRAALPHDPYIKVQPRVARRFGNDAAVLIATLQSWVDIGRNYSSSRERLAEATSMSLATLKRVIKKLKDIGIIETKAIDGFKTLTYFINYQRLDEETQDKEMPAQNEPVVKEGTSNVIRLFPKVAQNSAVQNEPLPAQNEPLCIYNNIYNNNNIHSGSKQTAAGSKRPPIQEVVYAEEYEQFWEACPRKDNKLEGYEAFLEVLKFVPAEKLIKKMGAYARAMKAEKEQKERKNERHFVCAPLGWLEKRKWESDYGWYEKEPSELPVATHKRETPPDYPPVVRDQDAATVNCFEACIQAIWGVGRKSRGKL